MGRSVSTPNGAAHVVYQSFESPAHYCTVCGENFDDDCERGVLPGENWFDEDLDADEQETTRCCPNCGAHWEDCSDNDQSDDFGWMIGDLRRVLSRAFPTVSDADDWLDREDHVIASNRYAQFGVSEYCGLVAVWCVPVEASYYDEPHFEGFRDRWIEQIGAKFERVVSGCFGTDLRKKGTFSNGEAFFQPANGQQKGALGLGFSSKEGWL